LWSAVLDTRFGHMAALRLVLLALAVPLVLVTGRAPRSDADPVDESDHKAPAPAPPWWSLAVGALSLGLFVTVAWAGHAGGGRFVGLALTVDVVHLGAMSIWLGGLVGLLAIGFAAGDGDDRREVVPRFSTLAFVCVITLVVTGSIQAWRQLGDLGAVTSTTYGRVLLVKLAIVAVLVGLAAYSRTIVRRTYQTRDPVSVGPGALASTPEADDGDHLERSVAFEVLLGVAVLVVTAFLVNVPPGIEVVDAPWTGRLAADELTVDVTIDPAATGPVEVHVFVLDEVGRPVDVSGVIVEMSLPTDDIGPLEVPVESAGPGHYSALGYEIPFSGDWDVRVVVRVTDFEEAVAEGIAPIS
jgi:copper transport protein